MTDQEIKHQLLVEAQLWFIERFVHSPAARSMLRQIFTGWKVSRKTRGANARYDFTIEWGEGEYAHLIFVRPIHRAAEWARGMIYLIPDQRGKFQYLTGIPETWIGGQDEQAEQG